MITFVFLSRAQRVIPNCFLPTLNRERISRRSSRRDWHIPEPYPPWSQNVRENKPLCRGHSPGRFHEQAQLSGTDLPFIALAVES